MDIGIIGAGNIGGTLARKLSALGHHVRVANSRDPQTLAELADESGATAVWAVEAPVEADLVIVSIPQRNVPDLAAGILKTAKPGVPIIETNNYYPQQRDGLIAAIEAGMPESLWVATALDADTDRLFKAFNGIWWKTLLDGSLPPRTPERIALPIAGADGAAKQKVFALVDELGFDPVDGGSLADSWRQHPGTPVYGKDLPAAEALVALAAASPQRPAEFCA